MTDLCSILLDGRWVLQLVVCVVLLDVFAWYNANVADFLLLVCCPYAVAYYCLSFVSLSHWGDVKHWSIQSNPITEGGTAAAVPLPFRPSDPALCGSRPLVTPYYCRLGDLLYIICVVSFVLIIVHVYVCVKLFTFFDLYFVDFLHYSDTVGWVFWPVKTVGRITYIVLVQTLNHAQLQLQSLSHTHWFVHFFWPLSWLLHMYDNRDASLYDMMPMYM